MSSIRRVSFFSGPGSGKSTTSSRLFSELKVKGYDVEHISEYIKTWVHEGRKPVSYDQLYVFAKQLKSEDTVLRNIKTIVTDSPIMLIAAWCFWRGTPAHEQMVPVAQQFDRDFPSLNFFIDRTVDYTPKGRYETSEQAVAFDKFLLEFLTKNLEGPLIRVTVDSFDNILDLVEKNIEKTPLH